MSLEDDGKFVCFLIDLFIMLQQYRHNISIFHAERKRLLQKPSVSTLDSVDLEPDPVNQGNDIELTPLEIPSPPTAKSGLASLCTEIPPPRMLKEAGYVDVVSSQAQKHVIKQSFHQDDKQANASKSPPDSLVLSGETVHLGDTKSREQSSSTNSPVNRSTAGSNRSNPSSIVSTHSAVSSHSVDHTSPRTTGRDVTLPMYTSPRLSPLEPQPMTMPDPEVEPKFYRLLVCVYIGTQCVCVCVWSV